MPLVILEPGILNVRPRGPKGDAGPPGAPGDGVSYPTLADAAASTIDADVHASHVFGHEEIGDGGHADYFEVASEPADPRKFQEQGGRWFMCADVDTVNAHTLGVKANFIDWDDVAMAKFIVASRGKRGIIPYGAVKLTSDPDNPAMVLEPQYATILEGSVRVSGNGETGSAVYNLGTGKGISIDGYGTPYADRQIQLRNFSLVGNALSRDGIYATQATGLDIDGMAVRLHGGRGIYLGFSFVAKIAHCLVHANWLDGIAVDAPGNIIVIENSSIVGNDASGLGYANVLFTNDVFSGTHLSASVLNCDLSGYGQTAFGLVAAFTRSLRVTGCDIEGCTSEGLYVPASCKGLIAESNTFSGSRCYVEDNAENIRIRGNTFIGVDVHGGLTVGTLDVGDDVKVGANRFEGGAPQSLGAGVGTGA